MKIAVTGANGFIGQALCQHLQRRKYVPIAITRRPITLIHAANRVVPDFTNMTEMHAALQDCQALVILASQAHTKSNSSENNLECFRKNNTVTAVASIKAASKAGIKHVIYLSSIKVNGDRTQGVPFTAGSLPKPVDAYGITKYETELALTDLAQSLEIELTIIRSPLVYGPGAKGNLELLQSAINRGIPLPFASLRNKRDLIALPVLCDLIITCLVHPKAAGQIFLASDGIQRSTPDIIRLISADQGIAPVMIPFPRLVLATIGVLVGKKDQLERLTGDLEIDITHTCQTLDWDPNQYKYNLNYSEFQQAMP